MDTSKLFGPLEGDYPTAYVNAVDALYRAVIVEMRSQGHSPSETIVAPAAVVQALLVDCPKPVQFQILGQVVSTLFTAVEQMPSFGGSDGNHPLLKSPELHAIMAMAAVLGPALWGTLDDTSSVAWASAIIALFSQGAEGMAEKAAASPLAFIVFSI